mmetsp:Transcript_25122/g.60452  ORF Transcript_25122/g.60452 Transcript_25122/m.60452 type:complete len:460 (-) Transcript_25122:211-1590(-)
MNQVEKALVSLSLILAGAIIGISCARAVPSSFTAELSLSVGILLLAMGFFRRNKKQTVHVKALTFDQLPNRRRTSSDSDSLSSSSSWTDGSAECVTDSPKAVEATLSASFEDIAKRQVHRERPPSPDTKLIPIHVRVEQENLRLGLLDDDADTVPPLPALSSSKRSRSKASVSVSRDENESPVQTNNRIPSRRGALPEIDDLPINLRVEQEKLRLSFTKSEEPQRVKTTSLSLRFQDIRGRTIRYTIKPSKKKSRATFLEVYAEGSKPRRCKKIIYDGPNNSIIDGKIDKFFVPPSDIDAVMKRLNLLCKIAFVNLECIEVPPTLRKVISNLDFTGSTITRVNSGITRSQSDMSNSLDCSAHNRNNNASTMRRSASSGGLSQISSRYSQNSSGSGMSSLNSSTHSSRLSSMSSGSSVRRATSSGNLTQNSRLSSLSSGSKTKSSSRSSTVTGGSRMMFR